MKIGALFIVFCVVVTVIMGELENGKQKEIKYFNQNWWNEVGVNQPAGVRDKLAESSYFVEPDPIFYAQHIRLKDNWDKWYKVIACESGFKIDAFNGLAHYGLFQFDYPTFKANCGERCDFANPYHQIDAAKTTQERRGWQPWVSSSGCSGVY